MANRLTVQTLHRQFLPESHRWNMKKRKWRNVLALVSSLLAIVSSSLRITAYADIPKTNGEYLVSNSSQCRRLLMELVSGAETGRRYVYTVTGKDYEPESLVIAQMFPDTINISNVQVQEYQEEGHRYVTRQIGFERIAPGQDTDQKDVITGDPQGRHWFPGDVRTRNVGEYTYRFRCIDDDYQNSSDDSTYALFLCETVIRSDIDSTESTKQIQTFGTNNNYRESELRSWLTARAEVPEDPVASIYTGVSSAFIGASAPGTFEQLEENSFFCYTLPIQVMKDQLFVLSLEEAFRYKDALWDVEDNMSPYSRGYWLRTPSYRSDADGNFCYGTWQYVVDLEQGCIRPAEVTDGSIGIRPAFCLPQM